MTELNARISLTDNFSSQIRSAINSTDSFQQAVLRTRRQLEDLSRQRYEATITARDEATQQISETRRALNAIKTNVAIMIGAKDVATDSVNRIKGHVRLLVDKPYSLVINAIDKTKSIISSITNSIFNLKTLALGIVFGASAKKGYDWTIGNAGSNEDYQATLQTVLHDKDKGNEALKWSYADAAKTPFDSSQVVSGVTQLATSQLDYTKYLNPLGDAAAAMNKPLEQAIFSMSKLKSGQYGIAVDMFRDFGISNDDWKGQGATFDKSGSLQMTDPQKAVDMVTSIINSKYGGLMERKSSTSNGMLSNMGDSISSMGRGLAGIDGNGQMMEGGLFDNFKKQLANIGPLLNDIQNSDAFSKLQKDIGQLATAGGDKLTAFLQGFKDPATIDNYKESFSNFVKSVKDGYAEFKDFAKTMRDLYIAIKPLIDLIIAHPKLFAGLFLGFEGLKGGLAIFKTFKDIKTEFAFLLPAIKTFGGGLGGVFKGVGPLFSGLGKDILSFVKLIPGGLSTILNTARLWVGMVGTLLKNNFLSILKTVASGIISILRPVFLFMMSNPIILAITAIIAVCLLLYEAWKNDWGGIREIVYAVIDKVKEALQSVKEHIETFITNTKILWQSFIDFFSKPIKAEVDIQQSVDQRVNSTPETSGAVAIASDYAPVDFGDKPHNALGTNYWKGGPTWVGEHGPELISLRSGTQILSNRNSQKALSGNGVKVYVTIQGNVIGNEEFADYVGERIVNEVTNVLDTNM